MNTPWYRITTLFALLLLSACGGNSDEAPTDRNASVVLTLSPKTVQLNLNASQKFTATVSGTTARGVIWTADGGSFSGTGNTTAYTAPGVAGTYTVTATSEADKSKTAQATVTVTQETSTPPGGSPTTPTTTQSNNSAILTGPTMGRGEASNDLLRKKINLSLTNPNRDFSLGDMYVSAVTLDRRNSDSFFWTIPITNVSSQFHCYIEIATLIFKDADGNTLSEDVGSFANGSLGENSRGFNDTCLAAGVKGYFIGISSGTYDSVASLEIQDLTNSDFDYTLSETRVTPQSYTVETPDSRYQTIDINIKNEGASVIEIGPFSTTVSLDDEGNPIHWNFIDPIDGWNGLLSQEQTNKMFDDLYIHDGTANQLYVSLDVSKPDDSSQTEQENSSQLYELASQGLISEVQLQEQLLKARNTEIEADLERLEQASE